MVALARLMRRGWPRKAGSSGYRPKTKCRTSTAAKVDQYSGYRRKKRPIQNRAWDPRRSSDAGMMKPLHRKEHHDAELPGPEVADRESGPRRPHQLHAV